MAHQTEIVVNGQTVEVTEFDHTAQEIDDMCDAAQSILPDGPGLPVSQGGTGATTPQAALAALGAGVRPNVLINGDFRAGHVVNQRGQTSYNGAGYTVDMLRLTNATNSKVELIDSGVKVSYFDDTNVIFEECIDPARLFPGQTYTVSVLTGNVSGGAVHLTENFATTETHQDKPIQSNSLTSFSFIARDEIPSSPDVAVWSGTSGATAEIIACKLEEGEGQTLAYQDEDGAWQLLPQPESDYATQLLKCQRYYQIYSTADARPSKAVDCRPVMRTDPAQGTIVVGDTTYYYNTAEL